MEHGRRQILMSAMSFTRQISARAIPMEPESCDKDVNALNHESMFPSADILHFILNGK